MAILPVILIIAVVFATYSNIIPAPFSVWDDAERIINNQDVHEISRVNVWMWFSKFYVGVYEPLVMFLYSIEYFIGKGDATVFHITGIVLHAINCVLLFSIMRKLFGGKKVALIIALLFGVHPAQTESVAWVAEQHTLLCGCFILTSIAIYISYLRNQRAWCLWLVFLGGIAAMLCKGLAVSLPVLLLAVHILLAGTKVEAKSYLLFAGLTVAAVVTGIAAIHGQDTMHWPVTHANFGVWERVLLACYIYGAYAAHLLLPVKLSLMYPYPEQLNGYYNWFLAIPLATLFIVILAWKKKWYAILGGIAWYSAAIAMVLQLVPYGVYLMADRFLYIAGIGLVVPFVYYSMRSVERIPQRYTVQVFILPIAVLLMAYSHERNKAWGSELAFFRTIADENPGSATAQYSLGAVLISSGKLDEAETYIDRSVLLDPGNYMTWYNKGILCLHQSRISDALKAFDQCLSIKNYVDAYFSRAMIYMGTGKPVAALEDIQHVLLAQPENAKAWYIKGYSACQVGDSATAIAAYASAIKYDPNEPLFYLKRGIALLNYGKYSDAIHDLSAAISLNADYGEAYYYRAVAKIKAGENGGDDLNAARQMGYKY